MANVSDTWAPLFQALSSLRASWPSRGWSWDTRLSCISSSFTVDVEKRARSAAALALATEFTPSTLHQAPPTLREVAESTGGLRSGQLLLASAPIGRTFAYGLWWPWGDGLSTSLRIGLAGGFVSNDLQARLRGAFGVEI